MKCLLLLSLWVSSNCFAADIQVYFSPNGGCTEAITNQLYQAKSSVLVQAYSFTSAAIAKAIVDAKKRGVKVTVILDSGQFHEKYNPATFFTHSGVQTFIDDKHAIAHNKVIIIDGRTVITGSFNFTKAAEEKNAENVLIIQDQELAVKFADNWREHYKHSTIYRK